MMKILIWLCIFLSIPLVAFTAVKQPSSISLIKESGKSFAATGIILVITTLLRFPAKRYLSSNHSKQHSFLRNRAQNLIQHHRFFALTALTLLVAHGLTFALTTTYWSPRLLVGSLTIFLFIAISIFGYFITKKRSQKYLFYNLHMSFLFLALSTALLHIKYKIFSALF